MKKITIILLSSLILVSSTGFSAEGSPARAPHHKKVPTQKKRNPAETPIEGDEATTSAPSSSRGHEGCDCKNEDGEKQCDCGSCGCGGP